MIPFNRLQAVDSIGRSVVSSFIREDELRLSASPPPHHLKSPPNPHPPRPPHRDSPHIPQINPNARRTNETLSKRDDNDDRVYGDYPHENVPSMEVMRWSHDHPSARSAEGASGNNGPVRLRDRLKLHNWGSLMLVSFLFRRY